uniref:G-protein coupled receptors family 1 profile domain-containing protein n=1 Tax=Pyxicephalus adspersus TaxID=30357 RepID=A0AAV2ZV61_PYXAD|nr:TPA: hypothetical protein GDO54_017352 [Pyxicephalus adspersus]
MPYPNHTIIEFILRGFSDVPRLHILIFLLVLLIYLITLGGNITTFLLVCLNSHLHTPMYFFLANLSVLDMSSSTTALHKIFTLFILKDGTISYVSCLAQLFIFCSLTGDQIWILAAMSYDRYVAICRPLYYHMIMSWRCCVLLACVCWVLGFLEILPLVIILSHFTCYKSNKIDHFFCDIFPLIEITCDDKTAVDLYTYTVGLSHLTASFSFTFIPYVYIISCILHISSGAGRLKAFYTCSSHIIMVLMFYMAILLQYIILALINSNISKKLFAVLNTAIIPMLNPLIYSLKNNDVKLALQRMLKKKNKMLKCSNLIINSIMQNKT